MTLKEAMNLAKEKDINVFSIAPGPGVIDIDELLISEEKLEKAREELKKYTESIGGVYFENTSTKMHDIVSEINKTTKSLINIKTDKKEIGKPEIPFILLIISITILFILNKKVKI